MNAWVTPAEHYSPSLHTVNGILAAYKPTGGDSEEQVMNSISSMGAGNDMRRDMEKRLKDAKETRQVRMAEELKSMELSPWMIDAATAKKVVGDDATEEQMKEFWAKTIKDMPDDEMTSDNSLYSCKSLNAYIHG